MARNEASELRRVDAEGCARATAEPHSRELAGSDPAEDSPFGQSNPARGLCDGEEGAVHVLTVARRRNKLGGCVPPCHLLSIPVPFDLPSEHVLESGEAGRRLREVAAVGADSGQQVGGVEAFERKDDHVARTRSSE